MVRLRGGQNQVHVRPAESLAFATSADSSTMFCNLFEIILTGGPRFEHRKEACRATSVLLNGASTALHARDRETLGKTGWKKTKSLLLLLLLSCCALRSDTTA